MGQLQSPGRFTCVPSVCTCICFPSHQCCRGLSTFLTSARLLNEKRLLFIILICISFLFSSPLFFLRNFQRGFHPHCPASRCFGRLPVVKSCGRFSSSAHLPDRWDAMSPSLLWTYCSHTRLLFCLSGHSCSLVFFGLLVCSLETLGYPRLA